MNGGLYRKGLSNFKFGLLFCGLIFYGYGEASESWYVVNNYTGTIGKYPIHLSIQSYDFGSDINIEGSYYYDHHNSPIALYGKETSGEIELCEISNKTDFKKYIITGDKYDPLQCPFKITKNGQTLKGKWEGNSIKLDVMLSKVASMNKTEIISKNGVLEVPFWGQTDKHIFIGIYEKYENEIVIHKINVVDKKSGHVIQTITPQDNQCDFGFYMTPIYQNMEQFSDSSISLNCYSTNADVTVEYEFENNKYVKVNNLIKLED